MKRACAILLVSVALGACSHVPEWMGGSTSAPKRADDADKRLAVVAEDVLLSAQKPEGFVVDIPDQKSNASWLNTNDAMLTGHLGITGLEERESATIGDGEDFGLGLVPTPVVASGTLYAMDGIGTISAHSTRDLDERRWVSESLVEEDEPAILGGGLALDEGVLYAATGYGRVAAFDATSGTLKWNISVGVPVRGAPQARGKVLVVITVDNQTLAFDSSNGQALWTHRGIRETAGFLSATSPVIAGDTVISAYSSGELVALRLESGVVLWTDTLINPERTRASDVFTGIDADPVVADGMVYAISTSGMMVANAQINGRTLWQSKIDGHDTPWLAGNMLYLLTSKHQLVGLSRVKGEVIWTKSLGTRNDLGDTTPPLFGPILAGNAVIVITGDGELMTFRPSDGKKLGTYDITSDVAAPPIVVDGALFLITRDGKVVAYR